MPFQQWGFSLRHWNSSGTWWQQSSELSLPKEKGLGSNSPAQGASQEIISHSGGSMLSAAPGWPSRAVAETCWGDAEERTWFVYSWAHSVICQELNTLQAKAVCSRQTRWLKPHTEGEAQDPFSAAQAGSTQSCPTSAEVLLHRLSLQVLLFQHLHWLWRPASSSKTPNLESIQKVSGAIPLSNWTSHWDITWPLNCLIYYSTSMLKCTIPVKRHKHGWRAEHLF